MVLTIPKASAVIHEFINIRKAVILALGHQEDRIAIYSYLQDAILKPYVTGSIVCNFALPYCCNNCWCRRVTTICHSGQVMGSGLLGPPSHPAPLQMTFSQHFYQDTELALPEAFPDLLG
jgi:hypothetical protein